MQTHPWNITPDELATNATALPEPEQKDLAWSYHYAASKGLNIVAFAAQCNISGETLRKVASGSYIDPRNPARPLPMPAGMAQAIRTFREYAMAAAPTSVQFVSTETSRRVGEHCDLSRRSNSPVIMIGASQIGKTTALRKYRDAHPNDTWQVTVTSGMGAKGLAIAICEELALSPNGSLATLTRRIGRAIPRHGLLIVDDFHVLTLASTPRTFLASMEFLRAVYDVENCGMLFSTTDLDYTVIHKEFAKSLHQLMRRGVHQPHLGTQPQKQDVRAILEAHGLKWPSKALAINGVKPWHLLATLALQSGLKVITERLRYALQIAARASVPVTWEHFVLADSVITSNSSAPANDWLTA